MTTHDVSDARSAASLAREHKAAEWRCGARRLPQFRQADRLGARSGARRRLSNLAGSARAGRGRGHRERRHPSRRGRAARRGFGLTPENFEAGRREARSHGVELEWLEADAERLPFGEEFDVVTSSFGAMFAPDHQKTADELLRVCRPGGTIVCSTSRPRASVASFSNFARYAPPPRPGAQPPIVVGSEEHVRELLGIAESPVTRAVCSEEAASPLGYLELRRDLRALIALRAFLADQPDRAAALEPGGAGVRDPLERRRARWPGRVPLRVPPCGRTHAARQSLRPMNRALAVASASCRIGPVDRAVTRCTQ